jgi:hypothetical protein
VAFLGELKDAGVDLYLDRQGVDTSTPAGKALFQMLGVFAEFERSIIQERIAAGIAGARHGHQERQADWHPSLQRRVSLSRDFVVVGQEPRLSAWVCRVRSPEMRSVRKWIRERWSGVPLTRDREVESPSTSEMVWGQAARRWHHRRCR